MSKRLDPGQPAPEFNFDTPWQKGLSLRGAMGAGGALLIFLRHASLPIYQMALGGLRVEAPKFMGKGTAVIAVLEQVPERISRPEAQAQWPFFIARDPHGHINRLYGVGSPNEEAKREPWWTRLKNALDPRRQAADAEKDCRATLPAVFVIGPDRRLRFVHYGQHPADMPDSAILLNLF